MSFRKVGAWAFLGILVLGFFPLTSENVSADSPEVWNQTSGNLASTDANWLDGTKPIAGDNIIFNATSTAACTWDLALTVGTFALDTGYSGTVTQAANFGVSTFTLTAGTFTGSTSYTITDSGNWDSSAGTLTGAVTKASFTGATSTIKTSGSYTHRFYTLTIGTGTYTATSDIYIGNAGTCLIGSGGTLTTATSKNIACYVTAPSILFSGSGTLSMTTFTIRLAGAAENYNQASWAITSPYMQVIQSWGGGSGLTLTMQTALTTSGSLEVAQSASIANTVNLATANYNITANGLTIDAYSTITAGSSTITCSGNWDSSAGTFTGGTSTLVMSGTSKTIKTANTNGAPYNLQESGTTTTSSSVNVTHSLTVDNTKTLTIGAGKTVDLNCSNGGTYSNLGTIAGSGTMEYSFSTADKTLGFGTVNAPVRIRAISTATANRTLTMSADNLFGSTLLVNSDHASNTMTLDARAVYLSSTGATTIGTRGNILYATFSIITSPGWGGGVQTGHSYTYDVNLTTTATPGEVWILTTNATWLDWDLSQTAIYGTPDSIFGGRWFWVNISVSDGLLTTYQNYTVLVVPIETMQDYIPLILALVFGLFLMGIGIKMRLFWLLAGPCWILMGIAIFMDYGVAFMFMSVGLGLVLLFMGAYDAIR